MLTHLWGQGVVLRGIPAVGCAGAVLVRFARSFVRFGSFERLLNLSLTRAEQCKEIETLANYCLRHCYPELLDEDTQAGVKSAAEAETEEKDAEEAEAGAEERKTASIFRAFFAAVSLAGVLIIIYPCYSEKYMILTDMPTWSVSI